jgi:isoamylase
MSKKLSFDIGSPIPLGTYKRDGGINFSLFSRHANGVWLEFYDHPEDLSPSAVFELTPQLHRTGDIWHIRVKGIAVGQLYAFRVDGPYQPAQGLRFNRHKLLLDPYAVALAGTRSWNFRKARGYDLNSPLKDLSFSTEDNAGQSPKCLIINNGFDWEGDRPLKHSWSDTIIYEAHVRGLTIHPSSQVSHPGTFLGIIEKIPHFKALGITALELMPIQEFNGNELERLNPLTGEPLVNYWGYNTVAFFAPKEQYSSCTTPGCQVFEFKTMVKELHKAGIEVILDIVFNHTGEGNELGPTINFRGMDNRIYYMLDSDPRLYRNYSGCGNTNNCNHPVVRGYILECLRYWVVEMHIDGFRFDLASVLGRGQDGALLPNPPLLETIAEDPILRDVKLIAEAWDAGGAYQVGSFPGQRWSEWNGHFRDDIRRFWRGDPEMIAALASRICGSADLYQHINKEPLNSVNFITCHDGFTLNDLVSYRYKHNEANGEGNQDGTSLDHSHNYGFEGHTSDPEIERVRIKQIKNMLATLFISRGVPMLLGGDEFRRTQSGNNNAYCQDNEVSWFDWNLLQQNNEIFSFTKEIIAFRKRHKLLRAEKFYSGRDLLWFDFDGKEPDWNGPGHTLGCMMFAQNVQNVCPDRTICILFNAALTKVMFKLPRPPSEGLFDLALDTAALPPSDIYPEGKEVPLTIQDGYCLQPRSMVILLS